MLFVFVGSGAHVLYWNWSGFRPGQGVVPIIWWPASVRACLRMCVLIVGVLQIMQYGVLSNLIICHVWNVLINTEAVIVFGSGCFF